MREISATILTFGIILLWSSKTLAIIQFLEWGDKCVIPRQGGEPLTEECDAGKGLVCSGEACVCTYSSRYSYDSVSKECRRKVGKPCQFVDTSLFGEEALNRLPFNVKCHATAKCTQLEVPVMPAKKRFQKGGVVDIEKISMCLCKPGLEASKDFNSCVEPQSPVAIVDIFKAPNNKLKFRPPYYT